MLQHNTHGHRILIRGEIEDQSLQDIGGEAGAVAFAADVIFDGSVL